MAIEISLKGKVAAVTGGRRGMGKEIALLLAKAGANVGLGDIVVDTGEIDSVAKEIKEMGYSSLATRLDVSDRGSVDSWVKEITNRLGGVDILVNAAGIATVCNMVDLSEQEWDRILNTNLKGVYLTCKAIVPTMIKRGVGGSIINIGSVNGIDPTPTDVPYNCSKAGVHMLTKSLAQELGAYGIRVNCIAPGWTKTPMVLSDGWGDDAALKSVIAETPLGRLAEPIDQAKVVLFLASDLASFVSGHVLRVDGAMNPPPLSVWTQLTPQAPSG